MNYFTRAKYFLITKCYPVAKYFHVTLNCLILTVVVGEKQTVQTDVMTVMTDHANNNSSSVSM